MLVSRWIAQPFINLSDNIAMRLQLSH